MFAGKTLKRCAFVVVLAAGPVIASEAVLPHLRQQGTSTQLVVDGEPYLALAAELHNSSASSLEYMEPLWPRLAATNINTVLATVSWELIEPEEGKFDFSLVDGLIGEARAHDLRLVFLWFASWKNGKSTYQPLWVKTNQERFPLIKDKEGTTLPTLTTLSEANCDADARAFVALMKHIRQVDSAAHTVLMMQIENEVGVLDASRDFSDAANKAFAGPVPKELMDYLREHKDSLIPELRQRWEAAGFKTTGTWEEVFGVGEATDEIFMAWNCARYIGRIAALGKAEYDIPMFVNAWLGPQPRQPLPGDYPSGGPLPHVMDIWRAGAPAIDFLAPDIYLPNFTDWCQWYTQSRNPLFIPESRGNATGCANAIWAIGELDAIGYSPFGIDRMAGPDSDLAGTYGALAQLAPLILAHQGKGTMKAVLLEREHPTQEFRLGDYSMEVRFFSRSFGPVAAGAPADRVAGLFISVGPDEYVILGRSMMIYFASATDPAQHVGLGMVEEGVYVDGVWVAGRRLNGDETPEWKALRFGGDEYSIQQVKLYRYR